MKRLRALACLMSSLACFATWNAAATERPTSHSIASTTPAGLDAAARKRLVGEHLMTLQWLGFGDLGGAGKVSIAPRGRELAVDGRQDGYGESAGDYVSLRGRIVSADAKSFVFIGDIVTRVRSNGDGSECRRSGTLHFRTTGRRRYWRLQEMRSPCSEVTDYVDVYFLDVKRPRQALPGG